MRIYELLLENKATSKVIDLIRKNCQPFLQSNKQSLLNETYLYTGTNRWTSRVFKSIVPSNRKPKDSPRVIHNLFDNYFRQQFGIAYRSNALFTTLKSSVAENYGNVYVVFPIGNYTILTSPMIDDLTTKFVYSFPYILTTLLDAGLLNELTENEVYELTHGDPFFRTLVYGFDYGAGKLSPAFQKFIVNHIIPKLGYFETQNIISLNNSEGMLHCNEYYAIKSVGDMDDIIDQIYQL
jgi:hypothetical protein